MVETTELKTGYKKTKLGWIPEGWNVLQLGEVIELVSGQHLNPNEYTFDKLGLPYFTGPTDFTHTISEVKKWTTLSSKFGIQNQIIITVKGSGVGSLNFLQLKKVALGRQLMSIGSSSNSNKFIFYFLRTKEQLFKALASGNLIPGLSRNDILKCRIPLPPLAEQKKIADILSTWDKAIETTQTLIDKLQLRKKGLMQQLLTGKKRLPGFEGEWEEMRLGDVLTLINGKAYKRNELLSSGKYRILRVGNLFTNKSWYYSDLELNNDKYIERGDLIYAWSASFGPRFWLDEKVIYHYHIWKIVLTESLDKVFTYYMLLYDAQRIESKIQGGTMAHITKGDMEKSKYFIPQKKEQNAIAQVLSKADKEIKQTQNYLGQLQEQKKGLMQQLLTGQRRVNV